MNSNEFWCRAFLAAMRDHAGDLERCQEIADAALWRAQRRGMVAVERTAPVESPAPEAVEFTAEPRGARGSGLWTLIMAEYPEGLIVVAGDKSFELTDGNRVRVQWGETCPPKPIKVWLERAKGGA